MKVYSSLLLVTLISILFSGCASLQPDRYEGNGIWVRGDGTTYQAAAPLNVVYAEILDARFTERVRVEESKTTNDQGQTVIREKEITEFDVSIDVLVELENGETYQLFFTGRGPSGSTVASGASFTASNNYRYSASGLIFMQPDKARIQLNISSKGPIRYQNTLTFDA